MMLLLLLSWLLLVGIFVFYAASTASTATVFSNAGVDPSRHATVASSVGGRRRLGWLQDFRQLVQPITHRVACFCSELVLFVELLANTVKTDVMDKRATGGEECMHI